LLTLRPAKLLRLLAVPLAFTMLSPMANALENNVALENLSGNRGDQISQVIAVPDGADRLSISISGGSGDADLYVRYGSAPTLRQFHCRPYRNGNREACVARTPPAGTYYIMLVGYADFPAPAPAPAPAPDSTLTSTQQLLLNAHNAARSQGRNCGSEFFPAAPPLTWNSQLTQAASVHSNDMANVNFFSHTGSDGSSAGQRVSNTGYAWSWWGENIAAGYQSVDAVMQGWLTSPGHCKGIMNPNFTEVGVAVVLGQGSQYSNYWTAVFARPQ